MYHIIQQYARALALVLFLGAGLGLMSTPAQAQMGIQPGVRAGGAFMTIGGDTGDQDPGTRTGFLVGGYALLNLSGPIAIQPEILFVQKGSSNEQSFQGTTFTSTTKLDYIEVPVLAKYQISGGSGFSPSIFAGPAVGFNANAERTTEGRGQSETEDISDGVSGTEFGLYFGAGADIGFGAGSVSIDARYNLGLSNIADTDGDFSQNNQGFMITAGFAF